MSSEKFIFVANNLALDFLNTLSVVEGRVVERLTSETAVLTWLKEAGVLRSPDGISGELSGLAIRLREEMREILVKAKGREPCKSTIINAILEKGSPTPHLQWDGKSEKYGIAKQYSVISDETLLQPIAYAFVHLVADIDLNLVKQCEAPDCILLFHDQTKSRRRRWCSMALCGNRMKVAAHRIRAQRKQG